MKHEKVIGNLSEIGNRVGIKETTRTWINFCPEKQELPSLNLTFVFTQAQN